nr:MAG TPA: hypothetical protein [Caudoviricetes sp.]
MRQLNIMAAWCLLSRHFPKQKARGRRGRKE